MQIVLGYRNIHTSIQLSIINHIEKHDFATTPETSTGFHLSYNMSVVRTLCNVLLIVRNFLYTDKKCERNCLSHAAQFPVLNGRKRSPTFHESSNISFNVSYLGYH